MSAAVPRTFVESLPAERLEEGERQAESAFMKGSCAQVTRQGRHHRLSRQYDPRYDGAGPRCIEQLVSDAGPSTVASRRSTSSSTGPCGSFDNDVGHLPTRLITAGLPAPLPA